MPRYIANPTPEQSLAAHLASSGASSLLDVKFARWLDSNDALGYMRYLYTIPTMESMTRQAPRPEKPLTAEQVLAQNQRERAARQAGRRRLSPSSSSKKGKNDNKDGQSASDSTAGGAVSAETSSGNKAGEDSDGEVSGSEGEDGYTSSTSTSSVDQRSPDNVRQDVLSEVSGSSKAANGRAQDATGEENGHNGSSYSGVPETLGVESHENIIYLAGNSLGLQSRSSYQLVNEELMMWQTKAVTGWFNSHHDRPWKSYAEDITSMMAGLVGASKTEVGIMGTLTSNLHLLMCSFYRPTKERYKIMFESKAFPSDNYAFASQAEMHGFGKKDALVRVAPRKGEYCLRIEDILDTIEKEGDQVAVVFFSGVNYFTGQVFDMQRITEAAHKKGCLVGWDLAHGVGNIPVELHKWNADFAVWCTYKYLNSGPGGIASFFVHEKHSERPRLAGWWGNNLSTRFNMAEDFDPAPGAAGFVISTPSILGLASLFGALESYLQCGKEEGSQQEAPASTKTALTKLRKKSLLLTAYLNCLFKANKYYIPLDKVDEFENNVGNSWQDTSAKQFKPGFTILTPDKADERGCQLSILLLPRNVGMLKHTNKNLEDAGVYGDEREPDVIRFSPVPLYNNFKECYMTVKTFEWALKAAAVTVQGKPRKKNRQIRMESNLY